MYTNLGNSGLVVSKMALGLGFRGQKDPKEATKTIHKAIDSGINFIDCANVYGLLDDRKNAGTSEKILGEAIVGKRNQLVITSKVSSLVGTPPNNKGTSRYYILNQIEDTLKRLQTNHIDIYLFHGVDNSTPDEEKFRTMEMLIQQGKIRYVGVCNLQAWQVVKSLNAQQSINAAPLITIQNPYSLLNRELEKEMFPMIRELGIGMMGFSPLAVGLLSGIFDSKKFPSTYWGSKRRKQFDEIFKDKVIDVCNTLKTISLELGYTMAQISQAWILSKPEVSTIISGADNTEQLDENLKSLEVKLPAKYIETLDKVSHNLHIPLDNIRYSTKPAGRSY